jgi:hypothetical protein
VHCLRKDRKTRACHTQPQMLHFHIDKDSQSGQAGHKIKLTVLVIGHVKKVPSSSEKGYASAQRRIRGCHAVTSLWVQVSQIVTRLTENATSGSPYNRHERGRAVLPV